MDRASRRAQGPPQIAIHGRGDVVSPAVEYDNVRIGAVCDLGLQARVRLAHHQPFSERAGAVGPAHELGPRRDDGAEPLRDRGEGLLQVAAQGPPEVVGVVVDDPIGAELRRCHSSHSRVPLRPQRT